jgi:BirA family transcriptional regulator, biotin operon repressor / biotin---[acetyl-CoA-carboxylase] ligase
MPGGTGWSGETPVVFLDSTDSTNAEALRRARAGERGPLWIAATQQTAGRGRRGRSWISPPGNLHASLLLTDPAPASAAPQLAFVAGLAVHDAAAALAPGLAASLALKWPNDMLCRGAKIAGILIEGEGDPVTVAIGIGVNCRHHPPAVELSATDFAEQGATLCAPALLAALSRAMATRLHQWDRGAGFAAMIRTGWLARAVGIGHAIRVRLAERETSGHFEAIDEAGRLILRLGDGRRETITAGEVFPIPEGSPPPAPGLTAASRGAP